MLPAKKVQISLKEPLCRYCIWSPTLHRIPSMIRKVQNDRKSQIDISFPEIEKFDHLPTKSEVLLRHLFRLWKDVVNIAVFA